LNNRYICIMELSKNFTLNELTASNTAKSKGISNEPDAKQLAALQLLVEKILQPLRDGIDKPIKVSSGLRVPALNKAIGGSVTSQHCKGEAVDIQMSGKTGNAKLFNYIKENLVFDQMIWEFGTQENPEWVHVSYSAKGNRGEILRAYKKDGRTRYMLYK
jgi:zinc D-Ala-D-Ala carboxypeptidase